MDLTELRIRSSVADMVPALSRSGIGFVRSCLNMAEPRLAIVHCNIAVL